MRRPSRRTSKHHAFAAHRGWQDSPARHREAGRDARTHHAAARSGAARARETVLSLLPLPLHHAGRPPHRRPLTHAVKATDENLSSENWDVNLQICDKVADEGTAG